MSAKPVLALSFAGFDPSGGAGILEDLKVFNELGVYGLSVISILTVQSSFGLRSTLPVDSAFLREQIECLFEDRLPAAAKIGLLARETIPVIIDFLHKVSFPVVLDTIFKAGSGLSLVDSQMLQVYRRELIPRATLITPNVKEAEALLDRAIFDSRELEGAARQLLDMGAQAVLIKGRHLDEDQVVDLYLSRSETRRFVKPRRAFKNVHGTGCALSAAIAAYLARGSALIDAVASAQAYMDRKLAKFIYSGEGTPVLNHFP